jgi:hypothetical protein
MDMIEFLVCEKLKKMEAQFYDASNGIRLVMAADGETLWYSRPPSLEISHRHIAAACVEFLQL